MSTNTVWDWIYELIRVMGAGIQTAFVLPVFQINGVTVHFGQILLFDFIVTLLLKFAVNLPTSGITINERIRKKDES